MRPPFLNKKTKPKSKIRSSTKPSARTKPRAKPKSKPRAKSSRPTSPRRRQRAEAEKPSPTFATLLTRCLTIIMLLTLATGTLLYIMRDQWNITTVIKNQFSNQPEHKPDPDQYASLIAKLKNERSKLRTRYLSARTNAQQHQIINQASSLLEDSLPPMMRCWLGHPYDFNGTATIPGKGKIACGYFVSVIMRDAGFKIDRIRVAQQPSQNIIRTFVVHKEHFEVKTNTPYTEYVDDINKKYEGIQIVGLDTHVAFIVIKDGEMRYIHSSGGQARCVVDEGRDHASSLRNSTYRVISNISRNRNVIKKWILGEPFPTVRSASASR